MIDEIARKGQGKGHIKAVGAKGQDTAVAKKEGLDEKGYTDG